MVDILDLTQLLGNQDYRDTPRIFRRIGSLDDDNNRRNYNETFGYPVDLTGLECYKLYERNPMCRRVVDIFPEVIWSKPPEIRESTEEHEDTDFEKEFKELAKRLNLWFNFMRVDKLARMGRFAVLYMGYAGSGDPEMPLTMGSTMRQLQYVKPYAEWDARIESYNEDKNDPNYGMPEYYQLKTRFPSQEQSLKGLEVNDQKYDEIQVHASRCLHISQGLLQDDVLGPPKLFSSYNDLLNIGKVLGSASEMFWLNGRGPIVLEAEKDAAEPSEEAKKAMKEKMEKFSDTLDRFVALKGVTAKVLDHRMFSPAEHLASLIDVIAACHAIPKRILIGSERGDLASEQDEKDWTKAQENEIAIYADPLIVTPFIEKVMRYNALTTKDYQTSWPAKGSVSSKDRAINAFHQAQAIAHYVRDPLAAIVVPPRQFVEDILDIEYREKEIMDSRLMEAKEESEIRIIEAEEEAPPALPMGRQPTTMQWLNPYG